jgi:preprotein translocase subunit SecD
MEFFIRQGATDPILKMRMVDDGKNDKSSFNDLLGNADITFEMLDVKTGEPEILNGACMLTTRTKKYNQTTDEYYITYRFNEESTKKIGKFEGKVIVQFMDINSNPTNKLILPIREKLFINVI